MNSGVCQLRREISQFSPRIVQRFSSLLRLAHHKRQALALDAKVYGAAMPERGVQAALGGLQTLGHARMIALIKTHGADEHLERAQKIPGEEIDAAGSGCRRRRSL